MPLHCFIGELGVLLCCLALAGCRGARPASENHAPAAGSVTHVVLFWLKETGNESDRLELIAACHALKEIPGVTDLRVGKVLPSTRPVVDSSYDVALVITFADEQALHAYGPHPVHQKLVQQMGPKLAKFLVYDFTNR
jgi:hypothetical protein